MNGNSYQRKDELCGCGHDKICVKMIVQQLKRIKKEIKKKERKGLDDYKQKIKIIH